MSWSCRTALSQFRNVAGAIFTAGLMIFSGCVLFEPRDPETGDEAQSVWVPPTTPEQVVANLELALENQVFTDYLRALTTDFEFHPDPTDSILIENDRPGLQVFANWNRNVEDETAQAIHADSDSLSLVFQEGSQEELFDGRLLKKPYTLTIRKGTIDTAYRGEARFFTRQISGSEWYVYRWEDVRSVPSATSWGFLKGLSRPTGS